MSTLLKEYMETLRMVQASDSSNQFGPPLPDGILNQFMAATSANDVATIRSLLDEHFSDRSESFSGKYTILELYPVLSYAARHDQVDVLKEILVPYPHSSQSIDFVAREAADSYSKNTLLLLLDHGWDITRRPDSDSTLLEFYLYYSTPDRDSNERRNMAYWLIDHGAGLNERPKNLDRTGLSQAVERAPVDFVRELIDHHGGDIRKGQLLHSALLRRPMDDIVEMLTLLLDRGAPLNMVKFAEDEQTSRHYVLMDLGTPLHDAAQWGNIEAVKYLLSQGADTSILSSTSKTTPLEWAERASGWAEKAGNWAKKALNDEVAVVLRSPKQYKVFTAGNCI